MNEPLIANKQMFYRRRALVAGQLFEATPVDAEYLVRRGQAGRVPDASVIKADTVAPVPAPVAAVVPALLPDPEVKEAAPAEAPPEVATEVVADAITEVTVDEVAPESFDPVAAETSYDTDVDAVDATAIADPVTPTKRTYRRRTPSAAE